MLRSPKAALKIDGKDVKLNVVGILEQVGKPASDRACERAGHAWGPWAPWQWDPWQAEHRYEQSRRTCFRCGRQQIVGAHTSVAIGKTPAEVVKDVEER